MTYLDSGVNPVDCAIGKASWNGHTKIVEVLLQDQIVDPGWNNYYAFTHASINGHYDVVKLLLENVKDIPTKVVNNTIIYTNMYKHDDIVVLLIPRANVNDNSYGDAKNLIGQLTKQKKKVAFAYSGNNANVVAIYLSRNLGYDFINEPLEFWFYKGKIEAIRAIVSRMNALNICKIKIEDVDTFSHANTKIVHPKRFDLFIISHIYLF